MTVEAEANLKAEANPIVVASPRIAIRIVQATSTAATAIPKASSVAAPTLTRVNK